MDQLTHANKHHAEIIEIYKNGAQAAVRFSSGRIERVTFRGSGIRFELGQRGMAEYVRSLNGYEWVFYPFERITMFDEYEVFDLVEALYFWLQDNWYGKSDPLYEAFCVLTGPGMLQPGTFIKFDDLNYDALDVYDYLTRDNYEYALNLVVNYEPTE